MKLQITLLSKTFLQVIVVYLLSWASELYAQVAPSAKSSVVYVKLSATSLEEKSIGETISTSGTGWFVDHDGRIVTARHLIEKLGKHDPGTRIWEVLDSPRSSRPEQARILEEDIEHDLILLKIATTPDNHQWLKFRGHNATPLEHAKVCYVGFPGDRLDSQSRCGEIVSTAGLNLRGLEYLWDTTLDSADGLSGSPVYLENCDRFAIGIIKGKDLRFGSSALVVPSKYLRVFKDLSADDAPCIVDKIAKEPIATVVRFAQVVARTESEKVTVAPDPRLRLHQMEIYSGLSGYIKEKNKQGIPSYQLDPYHNKSNLRSTPAGNNPIFNVIIENVSDSTAIVTSIKYRIYSVTQYRGGQPGPLTPNAQYHHTILWEVGDQTAALVPAYHIPPHSVGSFLLEITSEKKDIGLAWNMRLFFLSGQNKGISSDRFELTMSKGEVK